MIFRKSVDAFDRGRFGAALKNRQRLPEPPDRNAKMMNLRGISPLDRAPDLERELIEQRSSVSRGRFGGASHKTSDDLIV